MSERPTPETNAEAITPSGFEDDEVSAEFARKLERERDEARELLASEKITRNHIITRSVEVERERHEALELAQELLDALSKLVALNAAMTSDDCTYERAYYCYYKGHYDKWKLATEAIAKAKEGAK